MGNTGVNEPIEQFFDAVLLSTVVLRQPHYQSYEIAHCEGDSMIEA